MISSYHYTRTADGYGVTSTASGYMGHVAKRGARWFITDTARGPIPGDPHPYATRIEAVDALSVMLRAAAKLDAMPTDDEPAERPRTTPEQVVALIGDEDTLPAMITRPGDDHPSCRSCGYFSGHTTWCSIAPQAPLAVEVATDDCICDVSIVGEDGDHMRSCVLSDLLDTDADVADMTDHVLWVQFMLADRSLGGYDDDPNEPNDDMHGALLAEVVRRFGLDATERTADYSVAHHMSGDDLVRWAREQFPHLLGIATGRIVPEYRRGSEYGVEYAHGDCAACEALADSAESIARATGSVGATYEDGEHRATVARARQFVGR